MSWSQQRDMGCEEEAFLEHYKNKPKQEREHETWFWVKGPNVDK